MYEGSWFNILKFSAIFSKVSPTTVIALVDEIKVVIYGL